jgi:anti-sigma factor RsiW
MQTSLNHATEEGLERYSMGTLSEAEAEVLEEDLLVCTACQERLTETDRYVRAVRETASKLRARDLADLVMCGFPSRFNSLTMMSHLPSH